jgi:hypothetical protein
MMKATVKPVPFQALNWITATLELAATCCLSAAGPAHRIGDAL